MSKLSQIYDRIAVEMYNRKDQSKEAIVNAMTSYCVALATDGNKPPLWTAAGACTSVHRRIEALEGVKHLKPEE